LLRFCSQWLFDLTADLLFQLHVSRVVSPPDLKFLQLSDFD